MAGRSSTRFTGREPQVSTAASTRCLDPNLKRLEAGRYMHRAMIGLPRDLGVGRAIRFHDLGEGLVMVVGSSISGVLLDAPGCVEFVVGIGPSGIGDRGEVA